MPGFIYFDVSIFLGSIKLVPISFLMELVSAFSNSMILVLALDISSVFSCVLIRPKCLTLTMSEKTLLKLFAPSLTDLFRLNKSITKTFPFTLVDVIIPFRLSSILYRYMVSKGIESVYCPLSSTL